MMTILTESEFAAQSNSAKQDLYLKYWPYNQNYSDTSAWFQPNEFEKHRQDAWCMYDTATKNGFANHDSGILLLGGGIRYEEKLLMNFGTATVTKDGGNDAQTTSKILRGVSNNYASSDVKVNQNIAGSILADGQWSPLLNDAFILGGIHSGATFHLAEPKFEEFVTKHNLASPEQMWAKFFIDEQFLWQEGVNKDNKRVTWPRVFSREVLLLKAAGYTPVINQTFHHKGREYQQICLFFNPPAVPSSLTLPECTEHLEPMFAFQRTESPILMLQSLSEFIFGDPQILLPRNQAGR